MSLSGRLARAVANIGKSKPYVGLAGARQEDWQKPVARVGAEKEKSASCLPPFHRGCFLLVPLFTTILSALLPPWMFLARAIVDPHVATIAFATSDVACSCHCCPSSCHPCCCHRGCLLLVPLLTRLVIIAFATLDVSCSCHCWPSSRHHCYCHLGLFLLLVVLPPSSCHHGCYHLGVFLLVPLLTFILSPLLLRPWMLLRC